jgi:hypothetical protein
MLKAKLDVPDAVGVPEIIYVTVPVPFAKFPDNKVAVKPVTPVDVTT